MTASGCRHGAAAIAGAVAGAVVMLAASGLSREQHASPGAPRPPAVSTRAAPTAAAYVAWSPSGLPSRATRAVRRARGVEHATLVRAGLDWITATRTPEGVRTRVRPRGYMIPWDVAVIRPRGYAKFVPPAERDTILALRRGEVLLSATSAALRGHVSHVHLRGRTVRVAGVVGDAAANGYEALERGPVPETWPRVHEFLLVAGAPAERERLVRRVRALVGAGAGSVVRARGENPFLRYGDAVLPEALIKEVFGEFSARPRPDGYLDIDPGWRRANIRTARLPVLGSVTCHRTLLPQLRAALRGLAAEGLAHLVDAGDHGGCFSPRFINASPDARISHHSWGIAFDLNVTENPFGTEADLDGRVVEILEAWGFTWGGRWLVPDGMHFEWRSFP